MREAITNQQSEKIDYTFEAGAPECHQDNVLVLLGHGVTGNKDRPVIVDTAQALNAAGFDTMRFSFSGNGNSEGRFVDSTISKEVEDLGSILDAVTRKDQTLVYIGHSMGAAVGVLRASTDDRIHFLISVAGMVDTKAFAEVEFGEEEPDNGLMWEEPDCPLSRDFMKDLCETVGTVLPMTPSITIPWLLVHGSADDVVLPVDSVKIKEAKGDSAHLVPVDGADHSFNEPSHKAILCITITEWLNEQLASRP